MVGPWCTVGTLCALSTTSRHYQQLMGWNFTSMMYYTIVKSAKSDQPVLLKDKNGETCAFWRPVFRVLFTSHELFMQIVLGCRSICMQHLFDMMLFVVALRHIAFLFYYDGRNSRLFMNLCRDDSVDDGEQIPSRRASSCSQSISLNLHHEVY